ncbi:hypothetical protein PENSPDRAFT_755715 [Peniophora sp. CONT]|nr:hypothetical protein PENSPDRAFT_755715 [Peniophora sp. CONT]
MSNRRRSLRSNNDSQQPNTAEPPAPTNTPALADEIEDIQQTMALEHGTAEIATAPQQQTAANAWSPIQQPNAATPLPEDIFPRLGSPGAQTQRVSPRPIIEEIEAARQARRSRSPAIGTHPASPAAQYEANTAQMVAQAAMALEENTLNEPEQPTIAQDTAPATATPVVQPSTTRLPKKSKKERKRANAANAANEQAPTLTSGTTSIAEMPPPPIPRTPSPPGTPLVPEKRGIDVAMPATPSRKKENGKERATDTATKRHKKNSLANVQPALQAMGSEPTNRLQTRPESPDWDAPDTAQTQRTQEDRHQRPPHLEHRLTPRPQHGSSIPRASSTVPGAPIFDFEQDGSYEQRWGRASPQNALASSSRAGGQAPTQTRSYFGRTQWPTAEEFAAMRPHQASRETEQQEHVPGPSAQQNQQPPAPPPAPAHYFQPAPLQPTQQYQPMPLPPQQAQQQLYPTPAPQPQPQQYQPAPLPPPQPQILQPAAQPLPQQYQPAPAPPPQPYQPAPAPPPQQYQPAPAPTPQQYQPAQAPPPPYQPQPQQPQQQQGPQQPAYYNMPATPAPVQMAQDGPNAPGAIPAPLAQTLLWGDEHARLFLVEGTFTVWRTIHPAQLHDVQQRAMENPDATLFLIAPAHPAEQDPVKVHANAMTIQNALNTRYRGNNSPNTIRVVPLRTPQDTFSGFLFVYNLQAHERRNMFTTTLAMPNSPPIFGYPANLELAYAQQYIGAVDGLFGPIAPDGSGDTVVEVITNAIMSSQAMEAEVARYDNPEDVRTRYRSGIRITHLQVRAGNQESPVFAVYIDTPYTTVDAVHPFLTALRTQLNQNNSLVTAFVGAGVLNPDRFRCSRCLGQDHPATHCPFPLLPGWTAAPPIQLAPLHAHVPEAFFAIPEAAVQPNAGTRGTGTRGRGTGRGRGNPGRGGGA